MVGVQIQSTLIKYGAKVNSLIYEGEWWRFITPVFLHIGFLHLVMNTLALYFLGPTVERMYGNIRFLFIYLFAGITGFVGEFYFQFQFIGRGKWCYFWMFWCVTLFWCYVSEIIFSNNGE